MKDLQRWEGPRPCSLVPDFTAKDMEPWAEQLAWGGDTGP